MLGLGFCAGRAWRAAVLVLFGKNERSDDFPRMVAQLAMILRQPLLNALLDGFALGIKSAVGKERLPRLNRDRQLWRTQTVARIQILRNSIGASRRAAVPVTKSPEFFGGYKKQAAQYLDRLS